jgi:para-nitrobenzyl esterase
MKTLSRRQFIQHSTIGMGSALVFSGFGFQLPGSSGDSAKTKTASKDFITAKTTYGKIKGIREKEVNIFKGIPYAGSVSGDFRFARPAHLKPWKGVRDALLLGNPAMQGPNSTYGINEPKPAEDCLFLNVWTPANDHKKRPVMFYNHGGGYATGSGGSAAQDGANLARFFDVVVVQTNHRLNLFGFLYLGEVAGDDYKTSGNNGMLDIIDGLKWVNQNIAGFGGDPDNVMIFGESGGGAKTSCLYAMPGAVKYFNKASIESGPGIRVTPLESAAETTNLLLKELNITPKDWRKILEVPAGDLYALQSKLPRFATSSRQSGERSRGIGSSGIGGFSPVLDGIAILNHPFDPVAPEISRNKPLMVGWSEDEYTFFGMSSPDKSGFALADFDSLYKKLEPRYGENTNKIIDTYKASRPNATPSNIYVEIMSVTMMGLGSIEIAEKKAAQNGAPAYHYNFGYKSENKIPNTDYPFGTPHAMDIAFKFNNIIPGDSPTSSGGMAGNRPERFKASHNFAELWTTFARTGVPAAKGQPEWPPYNLTTRPLMRIDTACEVFYDRYKSERELWTSLGYIVKT